MMAAQIFIGTWEITSCISPGNPTDINELEGVRFRLDETGDVTWYNVPEEAKQTPLCKCETYEIYSTSTMVFNLRFGAYAGHVIEFRTDHVEWSDSMIMMCEGWCVLNCKRVNEDNSQTCTDVPFSLLPALEDGYFSDLCISSDNNKKFQVHTCVLQLIASDIDWSSQPPPLSGLPEPVLGTILHWLYAECLPPNLSELTAQQVMTAVTPYPSLAKLSLSCQLYLKNMALKQQIIDLVSDMHACCAQIIDYFNTKNSQSDNLVSNPAKFSYVLKQSFREAAVAGAKLLLLCDLFTKRKGELNQNERHEIIRYAKTRLPIFMSQLHRFLQAVKTTFGSMSAAQRQEVATYLIPEIDSGLEQLSSLILSLKTALDQIIHVLSEGGRTEQPIVESLKSVFFIRELCKLRDFHDHVTCSLGLLLHKRENFNDMTGSQKIRSVSRNLEQLIEELPIFLLRLEEVTAALDEKLEWREFKFCFKVGTSKVAAVLHKFVSHREALQDVLTKLCEIVQRDAFTQSLVILGLLDPTHCSGYNEDSAVNQTDTNSTPKQHGYKLNLVESLCTPPTSNNSYLSKKALQLLRSGKDADMEFEVCFNLDESTQSPEGAQKSLTSSLLNTSTPTSTATNDSSITSINMEKATISTHRVIVAARCDWFRRALLSGMREAINKKIVIHDTSLFLFRVFLDYLYSGKLVPETLTNEQLADLMMLSDGYELDLLKLACEQGLKRYIDDDSVLYFLSMADQFNAKQLKTACTNYISQHPSVLDSELFGELPNELQAELYELALWARPSSSRPINNSISADSVDDIFPQQPNLTGIEEMTANLRVNPDLNSVDKESMEELPLTHDSARLESCIAQLRDIVGEHAGRDELIQVALAADYDVNRAINFYYSS
ncbi:uncharacterized protein LOC123294888 [Chrysoperla carnea]|uniref:uncharacterized protein LOC123294888 n=1 Tax=Chrysoperla carnea TaxID=189513 RepID=UPI001D0631D1|nr:uncharacterized protein LOC123294888 [Chrysoperla carnea]